MTKDLHWVVRSRSSDQNPRLGPNTPLWVIIKKLQHLLNGEIAVNKSLYPKPSDRNRTVACETVAYLMDNSTYAVKLSLRTMSSLVEKPVVHFGYHFGAKQYQRELGIQHRQLIYTGIRDNGELFCADIGPYIKGDVSFPLQSFVYKPEDKVAVETVLKRHTRRSKENRLSGVKSKYSVNFGREAVTIGDVKLRASPFIPLDVLEETWGTLEQNDSTSFSKNSFFLHCDSEEVRDVLHRASILMSMSNARLWNSHKTCLGNDDFVEKYEAFESIAQLVEPIDDMSRDASSPDVEFNHLLGRVPYHETDQKVEQTLDFIAFVKETNAPWYYSVDNRTGYLKEDHHRVLFRSLYQ